MDAREYLAATRPLVERTIGRPLRHAEHVIDVFALTTALDTAKDLVEQGVAREQTRAIRHAIRTGHPIRLEVTRDMLAPLDELYRLGVTEAHAELTRAGYNTARSLEAAKPKNQGLDPLAARVQSHLNSLSVKLQIAQERLAVSLMVTHQGAVGEAIANALIEVLGARSIAADVVSTALFSGMGTTFEANQDLIGGFTYSSVLDGGTCSPCEAMDGTEYATWADAQGDMPGGGPFDGCDGGGRCRCRLVPT